MPLETGTYISDLVASNPAHTDSLNNADAHMRLIKSVLQATFPGANSPVLSNVGGVRQIIAPDGTSAAPGLSFAAQPSLGFWRTPQGVIRGKGLVPVGSLHMFPMQINPPVLGQADDGSTMFEFLELNGQTYNSARFPELAALLGGGPTFTVPNWLSGGRFPRSRQTAGQEGTFQANALGSHFHAFGATTSAVSNDHTHAFSGTTGVSNQSLAHAHTYTQMTQAYAGGPSFQTQNPGYGTLVAANTTTNDLPAHNHNYSGTTSGISANHTHTVSGNTGATGDTETRPNSAFVIFCIKT